MGFHALLHDGEFPRGGIYFLLLMALMFLFGARMAYRARRIDDKSHQMQMILGSVALILSLLYISILSFSRFIFPYIPATKGGGDYSESLPVHLTFKSIRSPMSSGEYIVPEEVQWKNDLNCLIVLDANASLMFLADRYDSAGPDSWRSTSKRPVVYAIKVDNIASVEYLNQFDINTVQRGQDNENQE